MHFVSIATQSIIGLSHTVPEVASALATSMQTVRVSIPLAAAQCWPCLLNCAIKLDYLIGCSLADC